MMTKTPHDLIDEEPVAVCPDCHIPLEENWLGNDRDPENWRLVGLECPNCCALFELVFVRTDSEDIPF